MSYTVSVRALCDFAARHGDLDLRFTPSPTAIEGMEGHALVRAKRPAGYQSEVSLQANWDALQVRGRADGYDATAPRIEEIKTYRGALSNLPDNHKALHQAQARVYAHMLCERDSLDEIQVALVYYDVDQGHETVVSETRSAAYLQHFFESLCRCFAQWAAQQLDHRENRDIWLNALRFPHAAFRPGQRQLAEHVYKAARQQRMLLAQAPTGIGKTIGTLFPMLKACTSEGLDRVFFLTAKTSGRQLALDALTLLLRHNADTKAGIASEPPRVRILELIARDKACEHPDKECHGASCPLAQGFYDRLPVARQEAARHGWLDRSSMREIALKHDICPYWMSHDLAQWVDVVVGDYNYYFDSSALLYSLTESRQWRVGLLVDEAHNLLERARAMYSASLNARTLHAAKHAAPTELKRSFSTLLRAWNLCCRDQAVSYQAYTDIPNSFHKSLINFSTRLTHYANANPLGMNAEIQRLHFDTLHFLRLAEVFSGHSVFDIDLGAPPSTTVPQSAVISLRNMIPAPFLQPRINASYSSTLFSATLSPWNFYRDTLGLPDNVAFVDVESPFSSEQLQVKIAPHISTRYHDRKASLLPIAQLMGSQYATQPGNYLSYFSSFDYLRKAAEAFAEQFPQIPLWTQSPGMDEASRRQFLDRFVPQGRGIGFAVLGGAFAEGIDLPGSRLIGVFISTLGLPQINPLTQQLKSSMAHTFGAARAYDYAFLYPGLQKVVQAAGRVIRSDSDRGVVYLIDDRYNRPQVRALFPSWWKIQMTGATAAFEEAPR
ncbi:ATP-dependent DNA helicase [Allopusillimonas ginsengisoli]|uniref:ATP-dependent DNA helicase n=1 Tax=Allopusillimonas ginsengisoli TaxID=453575 RepID=UPI0039C164F7